MASDRQIAYVNSLAGSRDLTNLDEETQLWLDSPEALAEADNKRIDKILYALKRCPYLQPTPAPVPQQPPNPNHSDDLTSTYNGTPTGIPSTDLRALEAKISKGRYFIIDPFDNTEKFIKVDKPEPPSRWAGYTFVHAQASDYFHPIKNPTHKSLVIEAILADPITAMNEYGIRLGVCGYCGRTLTARDSRLRGIGPICAQLDFFNEPTDHQLSLIERIKQQRREAQPNEGVQHVSTS